MQKKLVNMMKEAILMDLERCMQTLLPTVRYYEISILLGNTSVIKNDIIEPLKESLPKAPFSPLDLDYLEIDASQLFEKNINRPQKQDGGLLVINNFTLFSKMFTIDEQISTLLSILTTKGQYAPGCFGELSSGWRILFIEDTTDKDKRWPESCIPYFLNKGRIRKYWIG